MIEPEVKTKSPVQAEKEYDGRFVRGSIHVFGFGKGPLPKKPNRPWLVVSDNVSNQKSKQVIFVELTGWDFCAPRITEVVLEKNKETPGLLEEDSLVLCRSIYTVKQDDVFRRWGGNARVSPSKMREINKALSLALALPFKS
jgi:mRNA-degrading endonuclease toxin of MazEF toxin-antitoxin module